MIFWLFIYVMVGVTNYLFFLTEGKSLIGAQKVTAGEILFEAGFFIFAWPVQLGFQILVAINEASGWLLDKIFNG